MRRAALLFLIAVFITLSCAHKLEGPSPSVENTDLTYCGADQQGFVIKGSGLSPMARKGATDNAELDMPDVCLTLVEDSNGPVTEPQKEVCVPDKDVEWISQDEIRFTIRKNLGLAPGKYDVVIRNPDGKQAKGTITVTVLAEGPILLWADPNYTYNGIATQVTLYGANLGTVDTVTLLNCDPPQGEEEISLDFKKTGVAENQIQAIVPQGLNPSTCDVRVSNAKGCAADLGNGIHIVDTINLELTAIDPSFGWKDEPTPVTITGTGFVAVPRAYLNPQNPGPDTVASALASVAFVSENRLTAIVPKGLPVGKYELIVINPDGKVGRLTDPLFSITELPPPVVENISPNYLDNDTTKTVTVEGTNFRNPTVTLTCKEPGSTATTSLDGTVKPGGTATSFQVDVPTGGLADGTVCVVRVTNDDGSYYDYSAIGLANPSSNLNVTAPGPKLGTARRAPAVTAGRATNSARFIYAVGGDNGQTSGAIASVETAAIDIFGDVSPWFEQQVALPEPRTLAGIARVGRFLYLVGGNNGAGATASVHRAQVLDPLKAPKIVDVAGRRGAEDGSEGIKAGVWYYRVSAVMKDADPSNPGGETLPSDALVVQLDPETFEGSLVLTLIWEKMPEAKAFRIYRNENGDEPVGSEKLIAEIPNADGNVTTYEDKAAPGPITGKPPLPLGSTGVWAKLADLSTPREAAGVGAARDPANPQQWWVFAVGGRGAQALDSWEKLGVLNNPDQTQTVTPWAAGGTTIASGRSELSLFVMSHSEGAQIPAGKTYVWAGGGAESTDVDVAEVTPGGALTWAPSDAMSPGRSGYAGQAGAGFLFAFGGTQSKPSSSIASAEVDPGAVPALINWNNEGVGLEPESRYLSGSAIESAFIYVVGGATDAGPTNSMERTVL